MAGDVSVLGTRVPKGYLAAGGLILAAALAYGWYRNRSAAPAPASTAAAAGAAPSAAGTYGTDPYPPDGSQGNPADPYSTDPATGMTYGDEQAYGTAGPGYAGYGYAGGLGSPLGAGTPGAEFTSDGQWAQYAQGYLTGQAGADPATVSAALGAYITGQPLTAAQQSVAEQAIAFAGYPPVAGSSGYPPSIQLQATAAPAAAGAGQAIVTQAGWGTGVPIGAPLNAGTYGGPDLLGMTAAGAQAAVAGSRWYINHSAVPAGGRITSYTPYSSGAIDIG